MIELVLGFIVMLLLVAAMSVGVIFGRQPISGTCGGLNRMGADGVCEICGGRPESCEGEAAAASAPPAGQAYDATDRGA